MKIVCLWLTKNNNGIVVCKKKEDMKEEFFSKNHFIEKGTGITTKTKIDPFFLFMNVVRHFSEK